MTVRKSVAILLTATLAVALRLALYDHEFFTLARFPNHDLSQGAGFFVANLHSLRLSGEIAWWKSNLLNGYAHYFQTFFSPLAPTPGHIVFIVYAQLVLALDVVGLRISEYYHYLIVTYLILPWLAVAGFCWLVSLFVENRLAILFAGIVYALCGIGLWMGAWFYFQEPATLNFLLASSIALMQRASRPRLLAWLSAVLIQVASVNYWTVYNMFFVAVFLGGYAAFHPTQARSALAAIVRGRLAVAWALAVAAVWTVLLGSIFVEQGGRYVRSSQPDGFTAESVSARAVPLSRTLASLADRRAVSSASTNPMHSAHYIGAITIVLAACALLLLRNRAVAWLIVSAAMVAWITTAPPPVMWLWSHIPTMNRIQHLFYFYPHFLAQLLLLLAAIVLGRFASGTSFAGTRTALACVIVAASALDLSLYYRTASKADGAYTESVIWGAMFPMTPEKQHKLAAPLPALDPLRGFDGGVRDHLPLVTWIFPDNVYLVDRKVLDAMSAKERIDRPSVLLLADGTETPANVRYDATTWTYNTFVFNIDVPANGRLLVAQLPDHAWRYKLDGDPIAPVPARFIDTSFPVTAGHHAISMSYWPLARWLYWPAAILLELTLLLFAAAGLRYASRDLTADTAQIGP